MSNISEEKSNAALSGAINLLSSESGSQDDSIAPITLDIAEVSMVKKLIEQERLRYGKLTGNPILDFFYRINDWLIAHSKVTVKDLASFFRLLAVMINAGVPLIKSLETLSAQTAQNPKLARIISEISEKIEQGKSLSDAMGMYKDVFDDSQIGMTKSGEATGQLNQVLTGLADRLEKNASIGAKVKGALIYPLVIVTLLVVVVFVMMIVVVPKMTEFFTQSGKALPFATQLLINMSGFFQSYWIFIAVAVGGAIATISAWRKTVIGRYQWDGMLLKIPMFGPLIRKSLLARFARLLSDLLDSGVQVVQSLHIIADAIGNEVYRQRLILASQDVEQGIPLAESLNDPELFPVVLINMIEIGEQTAHLDVVAEKVAALYDDEVDAMVQGLTKAFEPILLIMIGLVVGGMVAAIMLPIMDMSNVAGA
ncbi:MAG: type II secretion system F family protein [Candidatus Peregrinibacteria bacterium]|nr:type II secretion system F family protein [Candidatus Peregrinibacteria bacterium]